MAIWARTIWVATVLLVPGGFLLFLGYVFARAIVRIRQEARVEQSGQNLRLFQVLARLHFGDLVREARASL